MRMNLLVVSAVAVALTTQARAAEAAKPAGPAKLYVAGAVGLSMYHDNDITIPTGAGNATQTASYKSGLGFAGALGYKYTPNVRFEGEVAYRKNKLDKWGQYTQSGVDVTVWNYGLNAYYDLTNVSIPVKPFFGAGIGYASGKISSSNANSKDSELSYQGIVGVSYPFDPNGNITLQYRYHSAQDFSKDNTTMSYSSSNFLVGVLYAFSL